MRFRVCPICQKRYFDWGANLMGKKPVSPMLVCPKCKTVYPDEAFKEPALEPYQQPAAVSQGLSFSSQKPSNRPAAR